MTKTWARRSVQASAIAAGFLLVSAGAAQAYGPDADTYGNVGLGTGNQAIVPIQAPIDVCGNATSGLGIASADCDGGSHAMMTEAGKGDLTSAGNIGALSGNQVQAPVQAPVNVCGNGSSLFGIASAGCKGGAHADMKHHHGPDATSVGNVGLGNGNQVVAPIQAPIDVSGNGTTAGGLASADSDGGSMANGNAGGHSESALTEGVTPTNTTTTAATPVSGVPVTHVTNVLPVDTLSDTLPTGGLTDSLTGGADQVTTKKTVTTKKEAGQLPEGTGEDLTTAGNVGVGNGNQVHAPIQVPVDVSGNTIAVGGVSSADSQGGALANLMG